MKISHIKKQLVVDLGTTLELRPPEELRCANPEENRAIALFIAAYKLLRFEEHKDK